MYEQPCTYFASLKMSKLTFKKLRHLRELGVGRKKLPRLSEVRNTHNNFGDKWHVCGEIAKGVGADTTIITRENHTALNKDVWEDFLLIL